MYWGFWNNKLFDQVSAFETINVTCYEFVFSEHYRINLNNLLIKFAHKVLV